MSYSSKAYSWGMAAGATLRERSLGAGRLPGIQANGPVAWAKVECEDCGASWQDVWSLIDITEAKGKNGKEVEG